MGNFSSKPAVHETFDPETDLVDLTGKVLIVTGGNKGIGYATVSQLLKANAKVYLAARSEDRAKEAISRLHEAGLGKGRDTNGSGNLGEVIWLKLDLSDPREAQKAAEVFLKLETRLDILVNNAAVSDSLWTGISKDGISSMHTFDFSYISPYVFTRTLLPLLKHTASQPESDVRIVNLASAVHSWVTGEVQFKTPEDFNVTYENKSFANLRRYGNSKLAVMLWSRHLQAELLSSTPPTPITVMSLHPGAVDTNLSNNVPFSWVAKHMLSLFMSPVEDGALTSVFASASKKVRDDAEKYRAGIYLVEKPVPGTIAEPSEPARDDNLGEELIRTTEKFLYDIGL